MRTRRVLTYKVWQNEQTPFVDHIMKAAERKLKSAKLDARYVRTCLAAGLCPKCGHELASGTGQTLGTMIFECRQSLCTFKAVAAAEGLNKIREIYDEKGDEI